MAVMPAHERPHVGRCFKAPERCLGRFSEHHLVAKKPYGPTVRFSCDVTCHLVWALKLRPRRHFVRPQLHEAAHSFSFISSDHGTSRQCNSSEDHKAVPEAATPRSFMRFHLQYSTDQQRETPSRRQEGTKATSSSTECTFGPLN